MAGTKPVKHRTLPSPPLCGGLKFTFYSFSVIKTGLRILQQKDGVNPRITIIGGLTLLVSAISVTVIRLETGYSTAIAGLAVLSSLGAAKLLNRKILEESTGRRTKAFQDLVNTFSLFLVISAAGLVNIVPVWLAVLTLAMTGVTRIFLLQINRRYRKNHVMQVGEDYWILLTGIILIVAFLQPYFIVYGLVVLNLVLAYDLVSLVRELER